MDRQRAFFLAASSSVCQCNAAVEKERVSVVTNIYIERNAELLSERSPVQESVSVEPLTTTMVAVAPLLLCFPV